MSVISKIKTVFWYLGRPKYYNQLYNLVKLRLFGDRKENTRTLSETWCEHIGLETHEALKILTGNDCPEIINLYPKIFKAAKEIVKNLPVKMGGAGNLTLLYHLCEYSKATNVIETGVANGWSSLAILLSLHKRNNSLLISSDMPYAKMGNEDFVGCVVPNNLKNNWELIRMPDREALPKAFAKIEILDLCHYDSDKTYQGRMWGYPKLWKKLKKGGYFISDDIGDNIAFKDFTDGLGIEPIVAKQGNQFIGIIRK